MRAMSSLGDRPDSRRWVRAEHPRTRLQRRQVRVLEAPSAAGQRAAQPLARVAPARAAAQTRVSSPARATAAQRLWAHVRRSLPLERLGVSESTADAVWAGLLVGFVVAMTVVALIEAAH